eukprot:2449558-Pleurochrysis_carterae.AAC.5
MTSCSSSCRDRLAGGDIQELLGQRHVLALALADRHSFGCVRTCLLFPCRLVGVQPVVYKAVYFCVVPGWRTFSR